MAKHDDRYRSVAALMSELVEGKDFRVRYRNRKSRALIIAPHGGCIEPGTSPIARAIAGSTHSYFDFVGLRRERPYELHVTSTRFRHPRLDDMLKNAAIAVSVHGMGDVDNWNIWLGGLNRDLKTRMSEGLVEAGFSIVTEAPRYKGEHPKNVVNLASHLGVQLELPEDLIDSMFEGGTPGAWHGDLPPTGGPDTKTTAVFSRFVKAVRSAIRDELAEIARSSPPQPG